MNGSLEMTKKQRIEYIDVLKGLGILSVVLLHSYSGYEISGKPIEYVLKYITSFHMALFFFLSGLLYNPVITDYKERIVRKIKTLLMPFVLWDGVIAIAVEAVRYALGSEGFANYNLKGQIIDFLLGKSEYTGSWFIFTLFMTYILEYLITFVCQKAKIDYKSVPVTALHVLFIFMGLFLSTVPLGSYYRLKHIFMASVFFYIGCLYAEIKNEKKENVILNIALLIIGIVLCFVNSKVSFAEYMFGNIGLMLVSAVCTICSLCGLTKLLTKKIKFRFLPFMGRNTIIIFYTHLILMYVVIRMLEKLLHMQIHTFPAILSFVIIVAIEWIMIKFMPPFFKRFFGIYEK